MKPIIWSGVTIPPSSDPRCRDEIVRLTREANQAGYRFYLRCKDGFLEVWIDEDDEIQYREIRSEQFLDEACGGVVH